MKILKLIGGILALIGGVFFTVAIIDYLQSSTTLYLSWFFYTGTGIWAIMGGIWAILADIIETQYIRASGLLILIAGVLAMLFGPIYYLTSDFAFYPYSFFVFVLNLPGPLWIFGIPIESIFLLTGGLLILWIKDGNK
jgi:hypothetical protein